MIAQVLLVNVNAVCEAQRIPDLEFKTSTFIYPSVQLYKFSTLQKPYKTVL